VILVSRSAADSDRSNDLSILLQWNTAGEDHDLAVVGCMNTEELTTGLRVRCQILCLNVECA